MVLADVRKEGSWLVSTWRLTFRVGWEQICKAAHTMYSFYHDAEILVDGNPVAVAREEDLMALDEAARLVIRGISDIIKAPLMVTFYNQLQTVDVAVARATEEFQEADYREFNQSLGQFLDSVELAMHR